MATEIISKRCFQCKQIKPLSEFSKDQSKKDGLQSYCKSCNKAYRQSEKGKAAHCKGTAKYLRTPQGKAANYKGVAKYLRTPKGKATMKRFYASHPNYRKAHNAVSIAITAGNLPRPDSRRCYYCTKPAQQYHHWHGYKPEHWLDVVPV